MKKYIISLTIGLSLSFSFAQSFADFNWGTGLETESLGSFNLVVNDISKDAVKIGLRKNNIETIAKLRLRKNGIISTNEPSSNNLYIAIEVMTQKYEDGRSIGSNIFSVRVFFNRQIKYNINEKTYTSLGTTFSSRYYGYSDKKDPVIDSLNELIDEFSLAYLEANE